MRSEFVDIIWVGLTKKKKKERERVREREREREKITKTNGTMTCEINNYEID